MMENLQHEKKTVGIKETAKALKQDKVKTLYIAEDAENNLVQQLIDLAEAQNVEVVKVDSMRKLGKACQIDVEAAAAAALK